MSDTPLCDNAIIVYSNGVAAHFPAGCLIVSLDFARTLERDLTAAKAKLEMAIKLAERLGHTPGCPANAFRTECTCGLITAIKALRAP